MKIHYQLVWVCISHRTSSEQLWFALLLNEEQSCPTTKKL